MPKPQAPDRPTDTWRTVLGPLVAGQDLPQEAAAWAMERLLSGEATPAQQAAFVVALRCKGETVEEIAGLADTMLDFATPIEVPGPAVDVVGSGGDRANTVNISTMAAIVAAAAGARVVKHGNRAASSACGAADVLEALGVALDLPPERQAEVVAEVGIGFLFAPLYHPALRHAVWRRELGIPTTFNFLGPLANPAQPIAQAVGVADARMAAADGGGLRRPWAPGDGGARRRRTGRADHDDHLDGLGLRRRQGRRARARPGRPRHPAGRRWPTWSAVTPAINAASRPRSARRAAPDRSATS